jgi:hypothetical protein
MVMARYYLHIRKGEVLECDDKDGAEFATLEDAYLEAFASAQELCNDLIRKHRDPRQFAFVIAGADGVALTELPFAEILDSCHPVLLPPVKAVTRAVAIKETCLEARPVRSTAPPPSYTNGCVPSIEPCQNLYRLLSSIRSDSPILNAPRTRAGGPVGSALVSDGQVLNCSR